MTDKKTDKKHRKPLFERVRDGLEECIAHEKGQITLKTFERTLEEPDIGLPEKKREPAPKVRRSFFNDKDELDYLHDRIEYWLVVGCRPARAASFLPRFKELLRRTEATLRGSIVREMYCGTVARLEGNIEEEIAREQKEIELVEELIDSGFESPIYDSEYVVIGYITLALLLLEKGDEGRSKSAYQKAKDIAAANGIELGEIGIELHELDSIGHDSPLD